MDLFLEAPLDFDAAWQRALREEIAPGLRVSFLGLEDLIALKETSDRPQDRLDVDQLRRLVGG